MNLNFHILLTGTADRINIRDAIQPAPHKNGFILFWGTETSAFCQI